MAVKVVETESRIDIEFDGDLFIIPNSAAKLDGYIESAKERIRNFNNNVARLSGSKYNEDKDKLVQVWITSDDLECDNVCRHYPTAFIPGVGNKCIAPEREEFPEELFKGKKEGDVVDISWPLYYRKTEENYDAGTGKEIVITGHLTLAQKKYRYRDFGTFEKALHKVL